MNTYETILKRRSIRKYKDQSITDEQIDIILKAAMASPSARNAQPWEFYVIKNKEVQTKIKSIAKNYDFNSDLMIVVCGNKTRTITKNDNDFFIQDVSAATQNILLTCCELGLGTVWCGIFPVEERTTLMKNVLNLSEEIIPVALIHIGYPDEEKEPRHQYKEEYVHFI